MSEEEFEVDWREGVMRVPYDPMKSGKKDRHQGGEKSRVWQKGHSFHQLLWNPSQRCGVNWGERQIRRGFAHFYFELWKDNLYTVVFIVTWVRHGTEKNEDLAALSRQSIWENGRIKQRGYLKKMLRAALVLWGMVRTQKCPHAPWRRWKVAEPRVWRPTYSFPYKRQVIMVQKPEHK